MTDLQYHGRMQRRAANSDRVNLLLQEALKKSGYRVSSSGLVVAPKKVCSLVNVIALEILSLLEE